MEQSIVVKGVGTLHRSPYLICGAERREMKKKFNALKSFIKNFYYYNDVDNVYGGGISKEEEKEVIRKATIDLEEMDKLLKMLK